MEHQISTATKYDRYPAIFKATAELIGAGSPNICKNLKVLSFGCSFGEEIKTLKDTYFPYSRIDGVEINGDCIEFCRERFGSDNIIHSYDSFKHNTTRYNVIFAMSVLCKWEETKGVKNCSKIYPFIKFDQQIFDLTQKLSPGGVLVIYNSNFCMFESSVYNNFNPITRDFGGSGFVHKFNSKNKRIDIEYPDVIFKKKH